MRRKGKYLNERKNRKCLGRLKMHLQTSRNLVSKGSTRIGVEVDNILE
jgi:hypothetical protein